MSRSIGGPVVFSVPTAPAIWVPMKSRLSAANPTPSPHEPERWIGDPNQTSVAPAMQAAFDDIVAQPDIMSPFSSFSARESMDHARDCAAAGKCLMAQRCRASSAGCHQYFTETDTIDANRPTYGSTIRHAPGSLLRKAPSAIT